MGSKVVYLSRNYRMVWKRSGAAMQELLLRYAANLYKEVFKQKPPMAVGYEFFLWNGKKMSSSKGLGLNAEELLELL